MALGPHNFVTLSGRIESGDARKLRQLLLYETNSPESIKLDSEGGDVLEAFRLGQLVRDTLLRGGIKVGGRCDSACFIVWASLVEKYPAVQNRPDIPASSGISVGKLGLHRPFFNREEFSKLTPVQAEATYRELERKATEYLRSVGVPQILISRMFATDSRDVVVVSDIDVIELMGSEAPFYEEWLIAKCGALSKTEAADVEMAFYFIMAEVQGISIGERRADYERFKAFSEGYKNYLFKRSSEIHACERTAINQARATWRQKAQSSREP